MTAAYKFFKNPFAIAGDKTAIPNDITGSGFVNYEGGFGTNYQIPSTTNVNYKDIERVNINQLYFVTTGEIQAYQANGVPNIISTLENGGAPFPYAKYAHVRGDDGLIYESLIDNNTTVPPGVNWIQSEVESSFFTDTSVATNIYTLSVADGKQPPNVYYVGYTIGFAPHESNTNNNAQIDVEGLGLVNVFASLGSPTLIDPNQMVKGTYQEFIYNGTGFVIKGTQFPTNKMLWFQAEDNPQVKNIEPASGVMLQDNPADGAIFTWSNRGSNTAASVTMSFIGNPSVQNRSVRLANGDVLATGSLIGGYNHSVRYDRGNTRFLLMDPKAHTGGIYGPTTLSASITGVSDDVSATENSVRLASLFNNFTYDFGDTGRYKDNDKLQTFQWASIDVMFSNTLQTINIPWFASFSNLYHVSVEFYHDELTDVPIRAWGLSDLSLGLTSMDIKYLISALVPLPPVSGKIKIFGVGN